MATRALVALLVGSLMILCSEKQKTSNRYEVVADTKAFSIIFDSLEQIHTPFVLTPEVWSDLYQKHLNTYGPRQGAKTTDRPYAKLADHQHYKAFLFISPDETGSPVIVTFDKSGKLIDELTLLGDWASNDPSMATTETAIVDNTLTIHLIDSVSTFDLTPDGDRLENTKTTTVKDERYTILETGKIEKTK